MEADKGRDIMAETYDLIFRGGTIANQDGIRRGDLAVRDGKVAALGDLSRAKAGEVVNVRGLHLLPGVIDTQVHFREPGPTQKEDLETGSRAAVMGGVTSVFEMPNTNPLTITAEALADKLSRAKGRMHCDHAFFIGGTHENVADLPELERLPGCAGVKVFMGSSTGSLLVEDDAGVRNILSVIRRRAAFHSEDEPRLNDRKNLRVPGDASSHPVWRDPEAALKSTERLVRLARETGARVHVLHISTAEEMRFLADHKDVATVEVTPHHLTLDDTLYATLGTKLQMNPPVRSVAHRDGIWWGVHQGVADVLGSDHAPHTLEEKAKALSGLTVGDDRRTDIGSRDADPCRAWAAFARTLRRSLERRPGAHLQHRRQGPPRGRLRRRHHGRRSQTPQDHYQFLDRLALPVDAL